MKTANKFMEEGASTFAERGKVYGNNYLAFGQVMLALFPAGMKVETEKDWNRLGIFVQIMSKITRYCENWENGGHPDSIHDAMVYAAMMSSVDELTDDDLRAMVYAAPEETFVPTISKQTLDQLSQLRRQMPSDTLTNEMIIGKFRDIARVIENEVSEIPF